MDISDLKKKTELKIDFFQIYPPWRSWWNIARPYMLNCVTATMQFYTKFSFKWLKTAENGKKKYWLSGKGFTYVKDNIKICGISWNFSKRSVKIGGVSFPLNFAWVKQFNRIVEIGYIYIRCECNSHIKFSNWTPDLNQLWPESYLIYYFITLSLYAICASSRNTPVAALFIRIYCVILAYYVSVCI